MCRPASYVFVIIVFLEVFVAINGASIARSTRSSLPKKRPTHKILKEISYQFSPHEMIEFFYDVDKEEAYKKFFEAYNKNRDGSSKLTLTESEIVLDELTSATSQTICRKPLPRVVNLYERLRPDHGVILSPAGIAVNMCSKDSGCCPPGEECVASDYKPRNFTYLHLENENLTVRSYEVLEDSRCTCRVNSELDPSQISGHFSSIATEDDCIGDREYNEETGLCECSRNVFCHSGTTLDEITCLCEDIIEDPKSEITCPVGKYFNVETRECECIVPCPTGTSTDSVTCACEDTRKTPTPNMCGFNRCPKPFIIDEETCTCECLKDDRNCEKITNGRKPLNEKHCQQVRAGRYGSPTCVEGMYFNSTGMCKCENL